MINLVASLSLKDNLTQPLRQVTSQMTALTRVASSVGGSMKSLGSSIGAQANQLTGLKSQIAGVASAYVGAQGAMKAFNSTVGAAAKFEQQELVTRTMFKDDGKAAEYMKLMDNMALKSAVLNSNDMMIGSKAFVGLTKDLGQLEQIWNITEKLQAFSGVDTQQASFSLKEILQGDYMSIVEAVGMDKKAMQKIAKLDGVDAKITAMSSLLDTMGVTDKTLEEMANSTLGQWSAITEKVGVFSRLIGKTPNTKLGSVLKDVNIAMDKIVTEDFAKKIGDVLGTGLEKVIDFGKRIWELRAPILEGAKAFGTFALAVGGIVTVAKTVMGISSAFAFLVSPIGLIATGITGLVFGFKSLYENSEAFRNIIDGIKTKARELIDAFKADGAKGVLDAILPEGAVGKITGIVSSVKNVVGKVVGWLKTKFDEIKPSLQSIATKFLSFKDTIANVLSTLLTISEPILSALWSVIQILGDVASLVFTNVIAPAIEYAMQVIQTLWAIAQPIFALLAEAIEFAFGALKVVWDNVLKPFVEWILGAFKGALETLTNAFKSVAEYIETFKSVWSGVWDTIVRSAETAVNAVIGMINAMIDALNSLPFVELKAVAKVDWTGDAANSVATATKMNAGMLPGHYHGLDSVPYDGYVARLHRGEEVLNAQEAKVRREAKSGNGGISSAPIINIANMSVREESDIKKVAYELAKYIESEALQIG